MLNRLLPRSDEALVRQALLGDGEAFERLIGRHQRRAHAIARAVGVAPDSLDDLVQEAFLAAFKGSASCGSPPPPAPGSWGSSATAP